MTRRLPVSMTTPDNPSLMDTAIEVKNLKAGDRTPWYEVRADAEPDPEQTGVCRVLVRHDDSGVTDYVRGDADEIVPVINAR